MTLPYEPARPGHAILPSATTDPVHPTTWWGRLLITALHATAFAIGALILLAGFAASAVRRGFATLLARRTR